MKFLENDGLNFEWYFFQQISIFLLVKILSALLKILMVHSFNSKYQATGLKEKL
jgi:hypothetical protein